MGDGLADVDGVVLGRGLGRGIRFISTEKLTSLWEEKRLPESVLTSPNPWSLKEGIDSPDARPLKNFRSIVVAIVACLRSGYRVTAVPSFGKGELGDCKTV